MNKKNMANVVNMKLNSEHDHDDLLYHVILPRVLPQEKSTSLYKTECDLMLKMVANVESLTDFIPPKTLELFQRLYRVHTTCTKESISREIRDLRPDDTFAMFVRFQHTGFMIHVPSDEKENDVKNVIVSTISNLHPDEIYKHYTDFEVSFNISNKA